MLKKRLVTAICGLPLLFVAVWFGKPWLTIIITLWGVLAVWEFYRMVDSPKITPLTSLGLLGTGLFIVSPHIDHQLTIPLLLTSVVTLSLILLLAEVKREGATTRWAWTLAGMLYIGWLLSHLVALRGLGNGREWVLFALGVTFASDTAAFLVGRLIGRHKLAPNISPGKTWEGAIAGLAGAVVVGLLLSSILILPQGFNYGQSTLLSLVVSVMGQLGDLAESLLKRRSGVKDSGSLLPGHGGLLDRLDSVVFAGAVVYYYVIWLTP